MSKIEDFKEGVKDVKETAKKEPHNAKRTVKYRLKSNLHFVLLSIIGIIFLYVWIFGDYEIPQAGIIAIVTIFISMIVMYPYAIRVVDYLVSDNRKPALSLEDIEDDLGVYKVPEERIALMEITDGTPRDWNTSEGKGIEVQTLEREERENGKERLVATATWEGSKSPLELKREYASVESMRNNIEPWARKGFLYETKLPHIIHQIQAQSANDIIYQFQDLVNYNGMEIHQSVQEIVNEHEIQNETSDEESEEDDLEKLMKMMENGEINTDGE